MSEVRLLLADEQLVYLAALESLLTKEFDVIGATSTIPDLISEVERLKPHVLLACVSFHDPEMFRTLKAIRGGFPETHIVVLASERDKQGCEKALALGASACVHATDRPETLIRAIQEAARQKRPSNIKKKGIGSSLLTARQQEILGMIIAGLPQKEIGARLHVSPKTVEFHKYRMMRQLGVKNSAELIVVGLKLNLLGEKP